MSNIPIAVPAQDVTTSNSLADLAAQIRSEHNAARLSARKTIDHALKAGDLLLKAKALAGQHGYWGDWLHAHCDISERTAQAYMRLARNRPAIEANPQATADLTIEDALQGLARPKPPMEIDADYAILPAVTEYLPAEGQARVGFLVKPEMCVVEFFGVIESEKHPGYYHLVHLEFFRCGDGDDDGGGVESWTPKPIRSDGIRMWLEGFTRHPNLFDQIEWEDRAAADWPFRRVSDKKWRRPPDDVVVDDLPPEQRKGRVMTQIRTFKDRDRWMREHLADPRPSATAKHAAQCIALGFRVKAGCSVMSYDEIGKGFCRSRRTAIRAVAELVELGWLAPTDSRGRRYNGFRLTWPTVSADVTVADVENVTVETPNGDKTDAQQCHMVAEQRALKNNHTGLPSEAPKYGRENVELTLADDDGGGGRLDGAAPQESEGSPTRSYAELRSVWARPWADDPDADRRAWEGALRDGAVPAAIIEAARAWVAAADAPQFLPKLATWLGAESYRKPPPPKRVRGPGRNGYRKPDACKAVLGLVGYVEDGDGRMVWQ